MPKINVSVTLFTCRHCGVGHNNHLKHVCVVPWSELSKAAALRKKR